MKKQILSFGLIAGTLFATLPSHALVRLVSRCESANGQYQVTVTGNQGIGEVRLEVYGAQIRNEEGEMLASYSVHAKRDPSISFGRNHYIDSATEGKSFDLAYGSTNDRTILLSAVLGDGTKLNLEGLTCTNY